MGRKRASDKGIQNIGLPYPSIDTPTPSVGHLLTLPVVLFTTSVLKSKNLARFTSHWLIFIKLPLSSANFGEGCVLSTKLVFLAEPILLFLPGIYIKSFSDPGENYEKQTTIQKETLTGTFSDNLFALK